MIQNPSVKPDVALVLKGKKGAGKDTLAEIMKMILGRRHYAPRTGQRKVDRTL